jgi:hypothetical protein
MWKAYGRSDRVGRVVEGDVDHLATICDIEPGRCFVNETCLENECEEGLLYQARVPFWS